MTPSIVVEEYRDWLRGLVADPPGPYADLFFEVAWDTDYSFYIPNDVNRAADGLALRTHYGSESLEDLPDLGECRMLEFLIGVAYRLNEILYDFNEPNQVPQFFLMLLNNLDLFPEDTIYASAKDAESDFLYSFHLINAREYGMDGTGGLFPLTNPSGDQREVEVWYQLQEYVSELLGY